VVVKEVSSNVGYNKCNCRIIDMILSKVKLLV